MVIEYVAHIFLSLSFEQQEKKEENDDDGKNCFLIFSLASVSVYTFSVILLFCLLCYAWTLLYIREKLKLGGRLKSVLYG